MDIQLLNKIIHMSLGSLVILVVIARACTLFVGTQGNQPNPFARKFLVGAQHFSMAFVVVSGLLALYFKAFDVQPWFYAKMVLFVVVFSSLSKAYKKDETILLVQRRAGAVLSVLALISLLGLVIIKPVFG